MGVALLKSTAAASRNQPRAGSPQKAGLWGRRVTKAETAIGVPRVARPPGPLSEGQPEITVAAGAGSRDSVPRRLAAKRDGAAGGGVHQPSCPSPWSAWAWVSRQASASMPSSRIKERSRSCCSKYRIDQQALAAADIGE